MRAQNYQDIDVLSPIFFDLSLFPASAAMSMALESLIAPRVLF